MESTARRSGGKTNPWTADHSKDHTALQVSGKPTSTYHVGIAQPTSNEHLVCGTNTADGLPCIFSPLFINTPCSTAACGLLSVGCYSLITVTLCLVD